MYNLNPQAARQADERTARIDEPGPYTGIFTRAEHVKSPKGAVGIDFAFETGDRQMANITIWTFSRDGQETYGMKQVSALMTCLGLRQIGDPQMVKVRKYDREAGGVIETQAPCFPELMNKPIGLLLETEEYEKRSNGVPTGETGIRPTIAGFYRPQDGMMAGEILDRKAAATQLAKFSATLKHKPLANRSRAAATGSATAGNSSAHGFETMDDDIPF